ncbi:MAG: hypothetical protein DLM54_00795 [Acidimicrobiales bacterium]|nr:MAG: hypothetical protein DLM54_00795 [Acidimicrobiales bacterium]
MSRGLKLLVPVLPAAVLVSTIIAPPAGAFPLPGGNQVRPNHTFGGLVNRSNGFSSPATIRMACFGPVRPGQVGHPMAGQSVEVFRPEAIRGHFGNTGAKGHSIEAYVGGSSANAIPPEMYVATFYRYDVAKAIPTSLELPCGGGGVVTFAPRPGSPTAHPATVAVNFVGQP